MTVLSFKGMLQLMTPVFAADVQHRDAIKNFVKVNEMLLCFSIVT